MQKAKNATLLQLSFVASISNFKREGFE